MKEGTVRVQFRATVELSDKSLATYYSKDHPVDNQQDIIDYRNSYKKRLLESKVSVLSITDIEKTEDDLQNYYNYPI